jgi:hypothetical protein
MNTGITINVNYSPLAFIFALCTPVIVINGEKNSRSWGSNYFELPPNDYLIEIYAPYLMFRKCGANNIRISLREGEQRQINFKMPLTTLSKGSINEIQSSNNVSQQSQITIPETCPICKNPNTIKTRLCEWCGGRIY